MGTQFELCRSGAEAWARQSGHEVRVVSTPRASNEVLALYLQLLAAGARDVDVLRIDLVWPGLLAPHLVDLREYVGDEVVAEHFPSIETHRSASAVHVRPVTVVEIAIDGVQRSTRYAGGVALRFARVKGYRPDKGPGEADTIQTLRDLLR